MPTPSGRPFTQKVALEYAREPWLLFAPARYEGIDARVVDEYRERLRVDEVSIGDYVLAGGEAAVLVIVEAVARLLPGVLGNARSVADDSFAPGAMENLLEGPVYTKPPVWRGHEVPPILLSGHHGDDRRAGGATRRCAVPSRPDLAARLDPTLAARGARAWRRPAARAGEEEDRPRARAPAASAGARPADPG